MKKILIGICMVFTAFLLAGSVLAVDGYCFRALSHGESTSDGIYSCDHTSCQVCTVETTNAYATWTKCDSNCVSDPIDTPELALTTNWPFADGGVYTKRTFFMDVTTNLISRITLTDNILGTQRILCPNCNSYKRSTTFKEGFNDVTIRAVKGFSIEEQRITFFVDSKKPVISKTLPLANKYAASMFTITYSEDNVKEIKLKYGNSLVGMKEATFQNCESGKKVNCSMDVPLNEYDGQQINYWFEITDIANNVVISKQAKIYVDETLPLVTSFSSNLVGKYMMFNMSVNERNFFKIEYMDNAELKPKWKTICASLKNSNCFKKISFRLGDHDIDIRVSDKAGNYAFEHTSFSII